MVDSLPTIVDALDVLVRVFTRVRFMPRTVACLIACLSLLSGMPAEERRPRNGEKEPLGLPPRIWPQENPYSAAKAELGRYLFFEKRLSADATVACSSCHDPQYAFTDGKAVSTGIRGQVVTRSAPTIINRAYGREQFWDGRAASLEEQVAGPITNPLEMDNTLENCVNTLRKIPIYATLFERAYGSSEITVERLEQAIATFERTVLSGNSPYDRYKAGDKSAISEGARRGEKVFFKKAKCGQCHFGGNFTDGSFANGGIGMDKPNPDLGRFKILGRPMDWGAFKVPTLREVARTAPYMHDGSLKTLEEAVEHYDRGGTPNRNLDRRYKRLNLTAQEKADLVEFLKSLSGEGWQHVKTPEVPLEDGPKTDGYFF